MKVTPIEIRTFKGRNIALLMKDDLTIRIERYIVARDYNQQANEWYGGGSYFTDLRDAVECFERLSS